MDLCSNDHDEVCFECRRCPVCEKMAEIEGLEADIQSLYKKIDQLEEDINP